MTLSPDGLIAVSMYGPDQICFYRENGELVKKFGCKGKEMGQFDFPYDLCFDSKGHLMVGEPYGKRIQEFGFN